MRVRTGPSHSLLGMTVPTAVVPPLLEAPTAIPGFRLEELIGRRIGAWSAYRAVDLAQRHDVTLTILAAQLNHDPDYGRRFARDMPLVATLEHPHLVRVLDAGRAPRGLYLVTEYEEAVPLEVALLDGALGAEEAIRLLWPVADALDHAHARGLMHRGVSPASIVVAAGGHALLSDFGLTDPVAAARGEDAAVLPYLAPEVTQRAEATPRSDVYGLAAVLFRVLTGAAPMSVALGAPDPTARRLPSAVEKLIRRSLSADPRRRASSASELVAELARASVLEGTGPVVLRDGTTSRERADRSTGGDPPDRSGRVAAASHLRPAAALPDRRVGAPRRRRTLVAAVGLAALAATVGVLLAALDADPPAASSEQPLGAVALTRELSLMVPASWSLSEGVTQIAGLPLDESMQLLPPRRPGADRDARLTVGVVRQADDRLLPPNFASRVTAEPVAERVRVGRYAGYRYAGLRLRGTEQRLNLYAVPTASGAATVACLAPSGDGAFLRRCEAVVTSLRLLSLKPVPLEPNADYVAALDAMLLRLNARRRVGRTQLRGARTPAGQARQADGLGRAYAAAATEQSRAPRRADDPEAATALVSQLRVVGTAYATLGRGARNGDAQTFTAAKAAVARSERRLAASLEAVRRAAGAPTA